MLTLGIDVGSRTAKVVLFDAGRGVVSASGIEDVRIHVAAQVRSMTARLLEAQPLNAAIDFTVATGYGRRRISWADECVTEIGCHARGVHRLFPRARTVVDIGGQDSKVILLDSDGKVQDFQMNDRCAAGTGRFLEMAAKILETDLSELGLLALRATKPATISSTCVVFAESEMLGLLAQGESREDIAAGVEDSIAQRVCSMTGGETIEPIVLCGGVALVPGVREALARRLGHPVVVPDQPQLTGAIGAALIGWERLEGSARASVRGERDG